MTRFSLPIKTGPLAALAAAALVGTATLALSELYPVAALGAVLFHLWLLALSGVLFRSQTAAGEAVPTRGAALAVR